MRINDLDKRRAILRFPEFKKDYESYRELKSRDEIYQKEIELEGKWGYPLAKIIYAGEVKHVPSVRPVVNIDENPYFIVTKTNGETEYESLTGDCLYCKVDLSQTYEKLEEDFKLTIRKYRALLKRDSSERESQVSLGPSRKTIWDVYDMRYNQNKKFAQIARDVFQVKGALGCNNKKADLPKSLYEQIRYAYKKAQEIMHIVRNELNLDISQI